MATQSQAVRDRFAYIDADPTVSRLGLELKEARKLSEAATNKTRQELRSLPTLFVASDLLFQQCWKFEGVEEDVSNELERLTCDGADSWHHKFSTAHDTMEELLLERCAAVVELHKAATELSAAADKVCEDWIQARKDAAAQFDADHPDLRGT